MIKSLPLLLLKDGMYYYQAMPFESKNARNVEVYVEDMIIKS